jgi:hypothetical protein
MAINLTNDFRTKGRIYGEKGAFFAPGTDGTGMNTTGKILSGGIDLLTIFSAALSGSTGDSMLTFGSNLTGAAAYKPTGGPVTVGVSFNPTFGSVSATSFVGALIGNATTASTWANSRTFTFAGGNVTGSFATNGSGDVSDIALNVLSVSSARWDSVYTGFSNISANIVVQISNPGESTQGTIQYESIGSGGFGGVTSVSLDDLGTTGSPTFANILITNNATVAGNLSVQGNLTFLDTLVSLTSALSVVNTGTGPALYVRQSGSTPLAQFVDAEGGQILFNNNGTVSIGTNTNNELLNIGGNILASNITLSGLPSNTTSNSLVVSGTGGTLGARNADSRIWGTTLVSGALNTNVIPKATGNNTIGNSLLLDDGVKVSLTATNTWLEVPELRITNSARTFQSRRDLFSSMVNISGTDIQTFPRTNLQSAKFFITLVNGTTLTTSFELIATAVPSLSTVKGTVFGIVDSTTGSSQLVDVDLSLTNTTFPTSLVLSISSSVNSITALIDGTALYNTIT